MFIEKNIDSFLQTTLLVEISLNVNASNPNSERGFSKVKELKTSNTCSSHGCRPGEKNRSMCLPWSSNGPDVGFSTTKQFAKDVDEQFFEDLS